MKTPIYNKFMISPYETELILQSLRENFKEAKTQKELEYYVTYRNLLRDIVFGQSDTFDGK